MLKAENIYKRYGIGENRQDVLKGIDLHLAEGEFVSIMGPSGSGKTTLLNTLSSIDRPTQGSIKINGSELTKMKDKALAHFRKEQLGFIFQDYHLLDILTVKENILLPMTIKGANKKEAEKAFIDVTKALDIEATKNKYPSELSGGQKQRVSAARAFIGHPKIIFADEPTGALDSKSTSYLLNKLNQLHKIHQTTILMVTHDPAVASYSSRVIFIKDGKIYSQLYRGDESRKQFLKGIMQTQAVLGGIHDE